MALYVDIPPSYGSEASVPDSPQLSPTPEMEALEAQKVEQMRAAPRRGGVAAQSISEENLKDYVKPVYPKPEADKEYLKHIFKTHDKLSVLFGHLEANALEDVANAFRPLEAPFGTDVIRQGDDGDQLYIVKEGEVDIFVRRGAQMSPDDKGAKVVSFGAGALFGELALMYSQPRAATVTVASSSAVLWALSRESFQMLLASNAATHLTMYEGWLAEVPIFKTLNHYELSRLADCVESELFDNGEEICRQGELGDKFYIIEDGTCSAFISGDQGEREVKKYESRGEYFGEIALLGDAEVRRATVRATGEGCAVVSLSKAQFTNLLGPLVDHLRKQVEQYPQYASFLI